METATHTFVTEGLRMTGTIEPWVTAEIVAAHLGFKPDHIRKLANKGLIPGSVVPGRRRYWRFKLSEVDAVWSQLTLASNVSVLADRKAN